MTTPARHRRAAPRGGTHARRRHDRGRRKAHARDARRWYVRDGGGSATVVRAWPCCAPSTAPPMWSRSASPAAGIALWRCGARPAASAMCTDGLGTASSPAHGARTAGSCRPTTTAYRAQPGSCWRTLMLGRGVRRL